jgi:hypothetical protein
MKDPQIEEKTPQETPASNARPSLCSLSFMQVCTRTVSTND